MNPKLFIPLFLGALLALCAPLRADFSGDFSLGSPANSSLVDGQTLTVGSWSALLTTTGPGGSGSVDTTSVPNEVRLNATGNADGGTGRVTFSYGSFSSAGVVSFNAVAADPANPGLDFALDVNLDGQAQTQTGVNAYSFSVAPGQVLSLSLIANGTFSFGIVDDPETLEDETFFSPGEAGSLTGTVSDFSFVSAVPEPSTYALWMGVIALGLVGTRRRAAR